MISSIVLAHVFTSACTFPFRVKRSKVLYSRALGLIRHRVISIPMFGPHKFAVHCWMSCVDSTNFDYSTFNEVALVCHCGVIAVYRRFCANCRSREQHDGNIICARSINLSYNDRMRRLSEWEWFVPSCPMFVRTGFFQRISTLKSMRSFAGGIGALVHLNGSEMPWRRKRLRMTPSSYSKMLKRPIEYSLGGYGDRMGVYNL
jgi:hypothetical protein